MTALRHIFRDPVAAFGLVIVAFALVHTGQVMQLHSSGGWALELQAFFFISALVVAMGHSKGK